MMCETLPHQKSSSPTLILTQGLASSTQNQRIRGHWTSTDFLASTSQSQKLQCQRLRLIGSHIKERETLLLRNPNKCFTHRDDEWSLLAMCAAEWKRVSGKMYSAHYA